MSNISTVVSQLSVQSSAMRSSGSETFERVENNQTNIEQVNTCGEDEILEEVTDEGATENEDQVLNKKKMFTCSKCKKIFQRERYAREHCKTKKPWTCPHCFTEIIHNQNIKRHREKCTQPQPRDQSSTAAGFICKRCKKHFTNKFNLKRHIQKEHNLFENNTIVCEVKTCPFTTKDAAQLKRHKTINHSKKDIFACEHCGHELLSQSGLKRHIRSVHRLPCSKCMLRFSTEGQLSKHTRIVHDNQGSQGEASGDQQGIVVSRVIGEHATHKMLTLTQAVSTEQ